MSPSFPQPDIRPVLNSSPGVGRQAGHTALSRHSEEEEEKEDLTLMMAMSLTARLICRRADRSSRGWTPRKAGFKLILGKQR